MWVSYYFGDNGDKSPDLSTKSVFLSTRLPTKADRNAQETNPKFSFNAGN